MLRLRSSTSKSERPTASTSTTPTTARWSPIRAATPFKAVDLSTGSVPSLGSSDFDNGYFTSGGLMGTNGVALLHLGESSGSLVAITP